jgi:hypothetical protein
MDEWNMDDDELKKFYENNFGRQWEQALTDALEFYKGVPDSWELFLLHQPWDDINQAMVRPILKAMGYDGHKDYPVMSITTTHDEEESEYFALTIDQLYNEWHNDFYNGY